MSGEFEKKPKTIDDIGNDVFISHPLYKRRENHAVIYVNPKLYEEIYKKKFDYKEAIIDIERDFSLTLNKNLGKDTDVVAYVDKQADPTDIALNGNKGSGRAFYVYENCNIKGDKTPFATSPRDDYSNGKYALDCAIQECLISNVLNSYDEFSNFETLAIIDLNEEYLFPHTTGNLPCGLMVRYAKNRELYRFSHRFVNNEKFTKEEIISLYSKIGQMEGNKFIHRFLHGAWSIGNLSIESNMIDLDTSFFLKGRHPQWSFTDRFKTNYFGYEYLGQIMVMETILNSELNDSGISLDEFKTIIETERIKAINKGFASLMGYDEKVYNKYKFKFDALSEAFISLSSLIYDNYDNLNCVDVNCNNTFIFDFSRFFRFYEILKQDGKFNNNFGLSLLLNKNAAPLEYTYDNDEYHQKIKSFFNEIIIDDETKYIEILSKAVNFIRKYDELSTYIDEKEQISSNDKLIKSYLENETKEYLTARKWIRGELIDLYNDKGEYASFEMADIIIKAYSKQKDCDVYLSDLTLFKEGYLVREISNSGLHRWYLKLLAPINEENLILNINGEEIKLKFNNEFELYSDYCDNKKIREIESIGIYDYSKKKTFDALGRDTIARKETNCTKNK